MSIEDLARKTVIEYGKRAHSSDIFTIFEENGISDESGELADEVWQLIQDARVNVKLPYAGV